MALFVLRAPKGYSLYAKHALKSKGTKRTNSTSACLVPATSGDLSGDLSLDTF
jgi:hypothetical protein